MIQPLEFLLQYFWFWCGAFVALTGFFTRRWRFLRNVFLAMALPCFVVGAIWLWAGYRSPFCAPPMFWRRLVTSRLLLSRDSR
jgi:hypothetical protein